jgi:pilus assembly protein Flp/PilA
VKTYRRKIARLIRDEEGASAAEYGLMVTLIALAILVGVGNLSISISNMYSTSAVRVADALP